MEPPHHPAPSSAVCYVKQEAFSQEMAKERFCLRFEELSPSNQVLHATILLQTCGDGHSLDGHRSFRESCFCFVAGEKRSRKGKKGKKTAAG